MWDNSLILSRFADCFCSGACFSLFLGSNSKLSERLTSSNGTWESRENYVVDCKLPWKYQQVTHTHTHTPTENNTPDNDTHTRTRRGKYNSLKIMPYAQLFLTKLQKVARREKQIKIDPWSVSNVFEGNLRVETRIALVIARDRDKKTRWFRHSFLFVSARACLFSGCKRSWKSGLGVPCSY